MPATRQARNEPPVPGRRRLIVAMVAASLPGAAAADVAGSVDFAEGNVMVFYSNGNRETLTKGMTLSPSDTVRTGDRGIAHIRFTDGGYVSVQKNSIFRIDEYEYDGSRVPGQGAASNKGFFSLLRGGFRAITGFLGASNYRITTPVATIGIRGTKYFAELGRSLTFSVAEGAIEVCNTAGCQFFRENEFGYIEDNAALIRRLRDMGLDVVVSDEQGETIATLEGDDEFEFRIAEDVNDAGEPIILVGTAPSCALANCTAAFGWVSTAGVYGTPLTTTNLTAVFENNALISHDGGSGFTADAIGTTKPQAAGSTPDIAWGRWTGGITVPGGFQTVHYVVGTPTPNINSLTGTRNFTVSGFTVPTTNTVAPLGAFNGIDGVLTADFDQAKVSLDFTIDFANADYRVSTFSFGSLAIGADGTFGGAVGVSGGVGVSFSATCSFGCNGSVAGFFAGNNADKAGLTYHVQDSNAGGDLTGAVVFD